MCAARFCMRGRDCTGVCEVGIGVCLIRRDRLREAAIGYESASHHMIANHTRQQDASSTFCAALRGAGDKKIDGASVAWPGGINLTSCRGRNVHIKNARGKGDGFQKWGWGATSCAAVCHSVDFPWKPCESNLPAINPTHSHTATHTAPCPWSPPQTLITPAH